MLDVRIKIWEPKEVCKAKISISTVFQKLIFVFIKETTLSMKRLGERKQRKSDNYTGKNFINVMCHFQSSCKCAVNFKKKY